MSLLVIGSAAFDSIQTPIGQRTKVIGGSGVYAACAAGFFTPVRLVGVVGDDWPSAYTDILRAKEIDLKGLEVRHGAETPLVGRYFENMDDRETLEIRLNDGGRIQAGRSRSHRDSEFVFLPTVRR